MLNPHITPVWVHADSCSGARGFPYRLNRCRIEIRSPLKDPLREVFSVACSFRCFLLVEWSFSLAWHNCFFSISENELLSTRQAPIFTKLLALGLE